MIDLEIIRKYVNVGYTVGCNITNNPCWQERGFSMDSCVHKQINKCWWNFSSNSEGWWRIIGKNHEPILLWGIFLLAKFMMKEKNIHKKKSIFSIRKCFDMSPCDFIIKKENY